MPLHVGRPRLDIRKNLLTERVVKYWKKFPMGSGGITIPGVDVTLYETFQCTGWSSKSFPVLMILWLYVLSIRDGWTRGEKATCPGCCLAS